MDHKTQSNNLETKKINGHRLSEFIYGIITSMVAISGISVTQELNWLEAATTIIIGASAIWVAHAYSTLLGNRIASGRRMNLNDAGKALYDSWPIVSAGFILALPLLSTAFGFLPLQTSLRISGILGLGLLALVGIKAGAVTGESWSRRIFLAAFTAGLGLLVFLVEFIVHH